MRRWRLGRMGVAEEVSVDKVELGTGGGAWTLSIAGIDGNSVVYSFGAGTNISFDLDLHQRTGAQVHVFDPTPRSIEWIQSQPLPAGVVFHPFGIGAVDGEITFYPPRRETSSHFSPVKRYGDRQYGKAIKAPVFTLGSIMDKLGHDHVDLVKLDIEGGEFDVIGDLANPAVGAAQALIEFHHNYDTVPVERTVESVQRLREAGFRCFHLSRRTYEMSFIREAS